MRQKIGTLFTVLAFAAVMGGVSAATFTGCVATASAAGKVTPQSIAAKTLPVTKKIVDTVRALQDTEIDVYHALVGPLGPAKDDTDQGRAQKRSSLERLARAHIAVQQRLKSFFQDAKDLAVLLGDASKTSADKQAKLQAFSDDLGKLSDDILKDFSVSDGQRARIVATVGVVLSLVSSLQLAV